MYNLGNLSDYDFELLCRDIAEAKLNVSLRDFARGRDGGIDITDSVMEKNIIIQAKHYFRSTFASLRRTLQNEKEKLEELKPKQYYVFCSLALSPDNVAEIYDMFSEYMDSEDNIIGLGEIQKYLEEHFEIVEKHYKLWLESSKVLTQLYNRAVFIDCDALMCDIEEQAKTFVKTFYYAECIKVLESNRILLLLGNPGVGKTMTSKMVLLHFVSKGYAVRYSADKDLKSIKNALDTDPDKKEIILLDDCFGQIYFDMKSSHPNELIHLIKYIAMHKNKIVLMNSRITVYKEAGAKSYEWNNFVENDKLLIRHIVIDEITDLEKAQILYNRMFYEGVPSEYWDCIKKKKMYLQIVRHRNYTPRVIEHITSKAFFRRVSAESYVSCVMNCLNNPKQLWDDEYCNKLREEDRILLNTLFSMTDKYVEIERLRKAFEYRISNSKKYDTTENLWESVLYRLRGSFLSNIEIEGRVCVGVINPSVNDYLKEKIESNMLEKAEIQRYACDFMQIERRFVTDVRSLMVSHRIKDFSFDYDSDKLYFCVSALCRTNLFDKAYKGVIRNFLVEFRKAPLKMMYLPREIIFGWLITEKCVKFYELEEFVSGDNIKSILSKMDLDEYISLMENGVSEECSWFFDVNKNCIILNINNAMMDYVENQFEPEDFLYDKSADMVMLEDIFWNYTMAPDEYSMDVQMALDEYVYDVVSDKIERLVKLLPYEDTEFLQLEYEPLKQVFDEMISKLDVEECMDYLARNTVGYYDDLYDEYKERQYMEKESIDEIEYLFR